MEDEARRSAEEDGLAASPAPAPNDGDLMVGAGRVASCSWRSAGMLNAQSIM
ncbi:hypothetical protein BCR44DRAFT_1438534, partial [Catenaria anguillulae PL171]